MINAVDKLLDKILKRVGLHIYSHDKDYDGSSLVINFLFGVSGLIDNGESANIRIIVDDNFYHFRAEGNDFFNENEETIKKLFCISKSEDFNFYQNKWLTYLRPIVWVSEHCITELSNNGQLYRQLYENGKTVGKVLVSKGNESSLESIVFSFTLPKSLVILNNVEVERLMSVINEWDKSNDVANLNRSSFEVAKLGSHSCSLSFELAGDGYSLRPVP